MALETLRNLANIDSFDVVHMDDLRKQVPTLFPPELKGQMGYQAFERDIRPYKYVYIRHDKNSITFNLQKGPIKEIGVNGCQVDTKIVAALKIIQAWNEARAEKENDECLHYLACALNALEKRRIRRTNEDIEGTSA